MTPAIGFVMNLGVGIGELACRLLPPKFPTTGLITTPVAAEESDRRSLDGVTDCAAMGTKTFGRMTGDNDVAVDGENTGVAGREEPLSDTNMFAASILAAASPSLSGSGANFVVDVDRCDNDEEDDSFAADFFK